MYKWRKSKMRINYQHSARQLINDHFSSNTFGISFVDQCLLINFNRERHTSDLEW